MEERQEEGAEGLGHCRAERDSQRQAQASLLEPAGGRHLYLSVSSCAFSRHFP